MKNRLTDEHKSSRGDCGYSDLALGRRVSKGSNLPRIYISFDELQHSLSNFIDFNAELVEPEDLQFFKYLLQMTFASNSFLFGAGSEDWCDNYLFDPEAFDWMINRIEYFKEGSKKNLGKDSWESEFLVPKGFINRLRLRVRAVESAHWGFRDDLRKKFVQDFEAEMEKVDSLNLDPKILQDKLDKYYVVRQRFNHQGSFLNKLSSYFFFLGFYEQTKTGAEFNTWISRAPKLSEFINLNTETNETI